MQFPMETFSETSLRVRYAETDRMGVVYYSNYLVWMEVGRVALSNACWVYTSARRYKVMGRLTVFRLYVRNFWSELWRHRPKDSENSQG